MTNILFLTGIFFCLYFIGIKLGNAWLGVLASGFLMLYPMFFHLSRMFMLETALICMVTLTITLLLYSEGFNKRKVSVFAGITLGLGLLTKQTFIVFLAGPVVFFFFENFFNLDAVQRRKRIVNLVLFIATGSAIALPWYLADAPIKHLNVLHAAFDPSLVPVSFPVFSVNSIVYYLNILVHEQLDRKSVV